MERFSRLLKAGINLSLGTNTAPRSMMEATKFAAVIGKIIDRQTEVATAAGLWQSTAVTPTHTVSTMTLPVESLELELLRLPTSERARLLDRVIASLDADKARDKAWDELAAQRDAEIERGESSPVSGPEVLARLRAELA